MGEVLVVDDDQTQQLIVSKILKRMGLKAIFANDGVEALEQVQKNHPKLVILDVLMPRMNGAEVCRRLKENQQTQKLPVVMYSAQERELSSYWGTGGCADAYLSKICPPQALIDTINQLLVSDSRMLALA
ncbi:MAG: response regulator [Symploca sp. SIO2G7]|nr:response regulator [Symploca sp. SIO2G7]